MNLVLLIQDNKTLLFLYRQISKIIKVFPYYLMQEVLLDESRVNAKPLIDGIELRFLNLDEIKEITAHPEVFNPEEEYVNYYNTGCLCLGAMKDGNILGFTWCACNEYEYKKRRVVLKQNEAYLFDARTFMAYRGKNLAPFLRYQLYKRLHEKGITTFYSLTTYSNTSSLKFKQKLGGRPVKLFLYICLCNTINIHVPIRTYTYGQNTSRDCR